MWSLILSPHVYHFDPRSSDRGTMVHSVRPCAVLRGNRRRKGTLMSGCVRKVVCFLRLLLCLGIIGSSGVECRLSHHSSPGDRHTDIGTGSGTGTGTGTGHRHRHRHMNQLHYVTIKIAYRVVSAHRNWLSFYLSGAVRCR